MVRDPYCVHAYWEVTEESVERITTELAGEFEASRPILRVHGIPVSGDPDEPQAGFFDVDLAADATSAYVDVPRPNRGYRVDVGLITGQGLFFPLASSNTVITPRDQASRNVTEAWAEPSAAGVATATEQPAPEGRPVESAPVVSATPAEADPAASAPTGAARSRKSKAMTGEHRDDHARGDGSGIGLAGERDFGIAPAESAAPEGHGALGPAEGGGARPISDLDLAAASGRGLAPAGPGIPPGPTGPDQSGPSPGSIVSERGPFHFVVHTELVVYGTTEPDAILTLQGSPVTLRPDGTFSLRFQLPDGEQVLRAVAVSRDGKVERVITPVVTRRTVEQETRRDAESSPLL
jgi:hypothetical protein